MPRFHFHIRDGQPIVEGDPVELENADAARVHAVELSGALLSDHALKFWDHPDWRIWVTDEAGAKVCALRFSPDEAQIEPSHPARES
jgi:hypothetical protein